LKSAFMNLIFLGTLKWKFFPDPAYAGASVHRVSLFLHLSGSS